MPLMLLQSTSQKHGFRFSSRLVGRYLFTPRSSIIHNVSHPLRPLGGPCRGFQHSSRTQQPKQNYISGLRIAILSAFAGTVYTLLTEKPLKTERTLTTHLSEPVDLNARYRPPFLPCTIEKANEILRWAEASQMVGLDSGVQRFDSMRIVGDQFPEDHGAIARGCAGDRVDWLLWGIFDGHAGWDTSVALCDFLVKYIIRELSEFSGNGRLGSVSSLNTDRALKEAFLSLDNDIMTQGASAVSGPSFLANAMSQLGPVYSGSCALVSYYITETQQLKVACTGDSRAVLGRRNASGGWDAVALSADQTGKNPDEIAKLQKEHPDEPEMIKDGRVLKSAVSRAFGDGRWKWSRELQEKAQARFYGPSIIEPLISPPYLTAEPVITTTKINPGGGDFLIMASDGLWENLTNEQAVDLVSRWLKQHDPAKPPPPPNLAVAPAMLVPPMGPYPPNPNPTQAYTNESPANEKHFIVADDNAATHLARNSLGGGDEERLCGMLSPSASLTRNVRDDICIHVVFFGYADPFSISETGDDTIERF